MTGWWDRYRQEAGYAALIGAVIIGVWAARQLGSNTVNEFCRRAFQELASGQASAQSRFEWERLSVVGLDVGMAYRSLRKPSDRPAYTQQFIEHFAKSFQETGARPENFVRWRLVGETLQYLVVGADYPDKERTLLFAVPKEGKRKVAAIQWAS